MADPGPGRGAPASGAGSPRGSPPAGGSRSGELPGTTAVCVTHSMAHGTPHTVALLPARDDMTIRAWAALNSARTSCSVLWWYCNKLQWLVVRGWGCGAGVRGYTPWVEIPDLLQTEAAKPELSRLPHPLSAFSHVLSQAGAQQTNPQTSVKPPQGGIAR